MSRARDQIWGFGYATILCIFGALTLIVIVAAGSGFELPLCTTPLHVACCAGQPELLGDIDGNGKLNLADDALLRWRFLAGD